MHESSIAAITDRQLKTLFTFYKKINLVSKLFAPPCIGTKNVIKAFLRGLVNIF